MDTRVCILTSRHRFDDARIYHKEVKTLLNAGYKISIMASDKGHEPSRVGVKVRLYRKWRFFRFLTSVFSLVKLGMSEQADIYHCHEGDSSLTAGVIIKGLFALRGKKVRLIYDAHEVLAYTFYDSLNWMLRTPVTWFVFFYEYWLVKFADAVITANDIVKSYFQLFNPDMPVIRLYNVPKLSLFQKPSQPEQAKEFQFCHEGGITFNRGIKPLFEAFITLAHLHDNWNFLFIGGPRNDEVEAYIKKMFITHPKLEDHVTITGWLPYEEVGEHLGRCEVGCIFLEPTRNNMLGGPPNKLFNYMRYGMPVIAPAYPEIERIITDHNCGILLEKITSESITSVMKAIINNEYDFASLGQNGQKVGISQYNWETEKEKLLRLYDELSQ